MNAEKTKKTLTVTIVLLLIVTLAAAVPILVLGRYDIPYSDDYSYSVWTHACYQETHSLLRTMGAAVRQAAESYHSWQGTFTAIFLMALQPAVFSPRFYAVTPWLILFLLGTSTVVFCIGLVRDVFRRPSSLGLITGLLVFNCGVQLMPSPVQGLYWYNGATYYVLFFSLSLFSFYFLIRTVFFRRAIDLIVLCVLSLILGGGNYVTALVCVLVDISVIMLMVLLRRQHWKKLLLPLLLLLLAFGISAAAPGNAVRQAQLQYRPDAARAFLSAFVSAAGSSVEWTSLPVIGCLILGSCFWLRTESQASFPFRFPALISLWSFCLLAAMFFPPLYAMGNIGDKRLVNIVWFSFLLLLFFNMFYWLGWLRMRGRTADRPFRLSPVIAGIVCVCMLAIHLVTGHGYTSLMALGELRSGEAAAYYEAGVARLAQLEDPALRNVELEPFPVTPYLLYIGDIEESADSYLNQDMSAYFGKESIVLKTTETE
ncbi:MAG: hypothetical protein IJV40_13180 [Oscillospiraceae bacterium]|nr:hypothetical protein [Oscillospiraceae bacterium]